MSWLIGFPLPFTFVTGAPPFVSAFLLVMGWKWGRVIRRDPELRNRLARYGLFVMVQVNLMMVYPAYNFVFVSLRGWSQTAFAALLPLIKLVVKNILNWIIPDDLQDLKPEMIIINAEVFHALFVAYGMQTSASIATTLLLMTFDAIHAWVAFHDMESVLKTIDALDSKMGHDRGGLASLTRMYRRKAVVPVKSSMVLVDVAIHFANRLTVQPPVAKALVNNHVEPFNVSGPTRITLSTPNSFSIMKEHRQQLDQLNDLDRAQYVSSTQKLLHMVEFTLLVEYVEVILPLIYSVFSVAMYYLPNRAYYPFMEAMSEKRLASNLGMVLLYVSLELASFITISRMIRRRIQISPSHQLAFVLHMSWTVVQRTLMQWTMLTVQTSLVH